MQTYGALPKIEKPFYLPLFNHTIAAGFPSPADSYIESYLDLNEHLIKHPASTFFLTASGNFTANAGIQAGDILIVDKSLEAAHGNIVIAAVDGELTIKRVSRRSGRVQLLPDNSSVQPIDITDEQDLVIWGVVTHIIHKAR